jgi:hypothetical protein
VAEATTAVAAPPTRAWTVRFAFAWLGLWAAQLAPVQLLLPLQLEDVDAAHKVRDFGLVNGAAGIAALEGGPADGESAILVVVIAVIVALVVVVVLRLARHFDRRAEMNREDQGIASAVGARGGDGRGDDLNGAYPARGRSAGGSPAGARATGTRTAGARAARRGSARTGAAGRSSSR